METNKFQYQLDQVRSGYIPNKAYTPGGKELGMKYYDFLARKLSMILIIFNALAFIFTYFVVYSWWNGDDFGKKFGVLLFVGFVALLIGRRLFSRFKQFSPVIYQIILLSNAAIYLYYRHELIGIWDFYRFYRSTEIVWVIRSIIRLKSININYWYFLYTDIVATIMLIFAGYIIITAIPNMIYCYRRRFLYNYEGNYYKYDYKE